MPIEFRCTYCYSLLRTADNAAGRELDCPRCGARQRVPVPEVRSAGPPPPSPGSAAGPRAASPAAPSRPGAAVPERPSSPEWTTQAGGEQNPYQPPMAVETPWQPPRPSHSGLAVASLVLGILSLPLSCCCGVFSFPLAVGGLATGILGLRSEDRGLAIAGIVLSSIGLVVFLFYAAIIVLSILMDNRPMPRHW
jgi:hypothetical protein